MLGTSDPPAYLTRHSSAAGESRASLSCQPLDQILKTTRQVEWITVIATV